MSASKAETAERPSAGNDDPSSLEELLDRLDEAARGSDGATSVGDVMGTMGGRSFGPLLLLAGLVMLAPLVGDIPGVPTTMGLLVLLISAQLLLRRRHLWLPRWLLERSVAPHRVRKAAGWLRRPARFIDRLLRPRLRRFVEGPWLYAIAVSTLAVALVTPVLELIPFSANAAGAVLTIFGLALIGRDGLVAIIGLVLAALTGGLAAYGLVSL